METMLRRLKRWWNDEAYWEQSAATHTLQNAWIYLYAQYWRQASSKERGKLLPENQEALDILHTLAIKALNRQCELLTGKGNVWR